MSVRTCARRRPLSRHILLFALIVICTTSAATADHLYTVTDVIVAPVSGTRGVTFNPANNLTYSYNSEYDNVFVIDGSTIVDTIAVGDNPTSAAFNPVNNMVYVTNFYSGTVSVIDGSTVVHTITGFTNPRDIAFNPANDKMYVTNWSSSNVLVVDGFSVIDAVPTGDHAHYIAFNPANNRMYVTNLFSGDVSVIDGTTVVDTVAVGPAPHDLAFNPTNHKMYVAIGGSNVVKTIDGVTVVDSITVGDFPLGVGFNPSNGSMYVVNNVPGTVSVIDDITIVDTVTMIDAVNAHDITFNPVNEKMYVGGGISSIYIIGPLTEGVAERLDELRDFVTGIGPGKSLENKVRAILAAVEAGDTPAACHQLAALKNEARAQLGKKLTFEQVTEIIESADEISALLDC